MVDFAVVPEKMALINVDMQGEFVDMTLGGSIVLDKVNKLASRCRESGILVVHTAHVVRADGSNTGVMGEIAPIVREGILNEGSDSVRLHKDLIVDESDIYLEKPKFGAFYGTDLETILRYRGIDTIIISGIATSICCETTAREAIVRDFRVFFLSDGTATYDIGELTAEQIQQATCTTLGFAFAQIIDVETMMKKLQK
jgi:nicotinamidase-related amidase